MTKDDLKSLVTQMHTELLENINSQEEPTKDQVVDYLQNAIETIKNIEDDAIDSVEHAKLAFTNAYKEIAKKSLSSYKETNEKFEEISKMHQEKFDATKPQLIDLPAITEEFNDVQAHMTDEVNRANKIISDLTQQIKDLEENSNLDALTKIFNRRALNSYLKQITKKNKLPHSLHLLMLDIDNFKKINDTYGHNIGDIVLKNLTQTIKSQIRSNDYLIRYGGEEFLLILNNIEQKDALKKIEKIFNTIRNTPINIGNKKLFITISGGVHLEPEKEKNIFEAIKKADQELYKAKRTGKNKYCIYSENSEKIFAINEITDFIESNSILVYLQPILNIKTNKIEKFEALARIKYKDEIFSPNTFLENIKNTNTYRDFTSIILDKVFKTISKYKVEISVNFFAKDFFDEKFITLFDEKEKKYKDLLSFLSIEILENEQIENIQKLQNQLKILKEKGIKISIDDFGSDYSNLSYLTYITPDYIKIDSSIVKEVRSNINAQKIIKTIVILAKEFNAKTIAEFVEDKDSFKILKSLNVDYIQGYYISPPLPIEEIEKII